MYLAPLRAEVMLDRINESPLFTRKEQHGEWVE